jgi:glycosyltransferase involved in cell wall biosynthesis
MAPVESILHVHTVPVISGSGINTLLTMKGAVARGHRVALATQSEGPLCEASRESGIEVFTLREMGREVNVFQDLRSVLRLRKLIEREQFTIVHTHNSKAGVVGRLAARLAGTPLVVHTVHGFAFHDSETRARRFMYRWIERRAAAGCDGLIFISQPMVEWADREGIGTRKPRELIYSGIDIGAFASASPEPYRRRWGTGPDLLVVGIVSKLWDGKGHEVLLRAWRRVLRDTCGHPLLVVVGQGPLEASLRAQAAELGIADSVLFTGFLSDIPGVTAALDISVLPSFFEGMGRVVLEAQAAGKPVVASGVGGLPDLIQDGTNGILVSPGDPIELADALIRLIGDRALRESMGRAARERMREDYSSDVMVERIHDFYDRLRNR